MGSETWWREAGWESKADYIKYWRLATGVTASVRVPIDVLARMSDECPALFDELDEPTQAAILAIRNNNGQYLHKTGSDNPLSAR